MRAISPITYCLPGTRVLNTLDWIPSLHNKHLRMHNVNVGTNDTVFQPSKLIKH
uniref:Uncharacterized protein n=1 Tax=Anguilla anguilla TaxID=7936 RepID=A0A0E9SRG1_ANGAN